MVTSSQNFLKTMSNMVCLIFVGFFLVIIGAISGSAGLVIFGVIMMVGAIVAIVNKSNDASKKTKSITTRPPMRSNTYKSHYQPINSYTPQNTVTPVRKRITVVPPNPRISVTSCAECQQNFTKGFKFCTTCGKSRQQWIKEQGIANMSPKSLETPVSRLPVTRIVQELALNGSELKKNGNIAAPKERSISTRTQDEIRSNKSYREMKTRLMKGPDSTYDSKIFDEDINLKNRDPEPVVVIQEENFEIQVENINQPATAIQADNKDRTLVEFQINPLDFRSFESGKIKFDTIEDFKILEFNLPTVNFSKKLQE